MKTILVALAFSWGGLVTQAPAVQQPPLDGNSLRDLRVVVLAPVVTYESLERETPLDSAKYGGDAVAADVLASETSAARSKGLTVLLDADLAARPNLASLVGDASTKAPLLARARLDDDARAALALLADADERLALLAVIVRVQVSGGGTWNPITGAITSSATKTSLRAALVECRSGAPVWSNSIVLRRIPKVGDREYVKAMAALFETLVASKE